MLQPVNVKAHETQCLPINFLQGIATMLVGVVIVLLQLYYWYIH